MTTTDRRPKVPSTFRSLANAILGKTGKPDRLDTATRMALDADFGHGGEPSTPERMAEQKSDPIDELIKNRRRGAARCTAAAPRPSAKLLCKSRVTCSLLCAAEVAVNNSQVATTDRWITAAPPA